MFSGQRNKGRGCHATGGVATAAGLPGRFVRTLVCNISLSQPDMTAVESFCSPHYATDRQLFSRKAALLNHVADYQPFSVVPEDGVLQWFPLWSLAERDHYGSQEEHVHTVGDPFGESRQHHRGSLLTCPLRDDGLQHPSGLTLWQILGRLQRLQHSRGP